MKREKRDDNMKYMNLPKRALSCALAFALAFSMTPSSAFANNSNSQQTGETPAQEQTDAAANTTDAQPSSDIQIESRDVPIVSGNGKPDASEAVDAASSAGDASAESVPEANTEADNATEEPAADEANKEDLDIISTQVSLAGETDVAMLFSHNGLNYQVNANDPTTVTLVGFSNAPAGALVIPETVVCGSSTYTVTGLQKIAGGGAPSLILQKAK